MDLSQDVRDWLRVAAFADQHHDTYPAIEATRFNLRGRSVFITGASKGVGKTTAIRFAAAGASKIVIGARSSLTEVADAVDAAAKAASHPPPQVLALQLDVTSEESVKAAADKYRSQIGAELDVLINNAGYLETWKPIAESDPVDWWKSWEVNIKGSYLVARAFLPLLLAGKAKTLINLSSAGAHNMSWGGSAYQTSRFATCRFTEFADREYKGQGLIAIALHPGGVKTELALNMPEYRHQVLIDKPELSADTMVWLSVERREWLAGRFVSSTWDMEELQKKKKDDIVKKDLLKFRLIM